VSANESSAEDADSLSVGGWHLLYSIPPLFYVFPQERHKQCSIFPVLASSLAVLTGDNIEHFGDFRAFKQPPCGILTMSLEFLTASDI